MRNCMGTSPLFFNSSGVIPGTIWRIKKRGHKSMVIISWRARFIADVGDKCHMCASDIPNPISQRFWDCRIARQAWDYSIASSIR